MPRSRTTPRRALGAVAIAAALLFVQAVGVVHELVSVHAVCLEHGDYLEAGHTGADEAPPPAGLSRSAEQASLSAPAHDHCEALNGRRTLPPLAASALPPGAPRAVPAAPVVDVQRPPIALLRLAPKASPPA